MKTDKKTKKNAGMTYVELIVVLSIFAIMSAISFFNYGTFQKKVDIKVLANDIALQIIQAQKDALSGKLPLTGSFDSGKPSYGVYFNTESPNEFIYFANLNNINSFDKEGDLILDKIIITKNNFISGVGTYYPDNPLGNLNPVSSKSLNLAITFTRPNSGASIYSNGELITGIEYAQISISSPGANPVTSHIKVYPSGRVQIN